MRYMKTVVAAVLIYLAVFLIVLVVAQVFTGYDFTAAYAAVSLSGIAELALTSVIKRSEKIYDRKYGKDDNHE